MFHNEIKHSTKECQKMKDEIEYIVRKEYIEEFCANYKATTIATTMTYLISKRIGPITNTSSLGGQTQIMHNGHTHLGKVQAKRSYMFLHVQPE